MAPVDKSQKKIAYEASKEAGKWPEPSTFKVLTVLGGSLWMTYSIYSSAQMIWNWLQKKIQDKSTPEQRNRLVRRETCHQIEKRWAPFDASINVLYWLQRVVRWIYHQADMLPVRIQNGVDREYKATHDDLWETKNEEADEKLKVILAKEFPEYYKQKFLDPFEEGSELYTQNKQILEDIEHAEGQLQARAYNIVDKPDIADL